MVDFVGSLTEEEKELLREFGVDAHWIDTIREAQQLRRTRAAAVASRPRHTLGDLKRAQEDSGLSVAQLALTGPAAPPNAALTGPPTVEAEDVGGGLTLFGGGSASSNPASFRRASLSTGYTAPPIGGDPAANIALKLPAAAAAAIIQMERRPFEAFLDTPEGEKVVERLVSAPPTEAVQGLLGGSAGSWHRDERTHAGICGASRAAR